MLLEEHVQRLQDLLGAPPPHDSGWAYACCCESREIHEYVWLLRSDRAYVTGVVIPLLLETEKAVGKAQRVDEYGQLIPAFVRNIGKRARNLRHYVNGRPSDFVPSDPLEEHLATALEQ